MARRGRPGWEAMRCALTRDELGRLKDQIHISLWVQTKPTPRQFWQFIASIPLGDAAADRVRLRGGHGGIS